MKKNLYPILLILLLILVIYTRFINLPWGLPYPFHPDERNMADAIMRLKCLNFDLECLNPHFFAYGQLPLYLGYFGIRLFHFFSKITTEITFNEAVISLRVISALASVFTFILLFKILGIFLDSSMFKHLWVFKKDSLAAKKIILILSSFVFIFSPVLIQLAHFGTTESLLMFFYTFILYLSLKYWVNKITFARYLIISGVACGLALATKVSSYSFLFIPAIVTLYHFKSESLYKRIVLTFFSFFQFLTLSLLVGVVFSPYNFIAFNEFLGSMQYESAVGFGKALVFYTRQFDFTLPIIFQFSSIFPYALGLWTTTIFIVGFFLLPVRREVTLLRLAFVLYFLLNAFLYTKWTRFMAPVFPVMILITVLTLIYVYDYVAQKIQKTNGLIFMHIIVLIIGFISILPGIAYLSVYKNPDVRFVASEWIYKKIPQDSKIFSETANVVDVPIINPLVKERDLKLYQVISFNHYDVDTDNELKASFYATIPQADYIFVPSRRVFANSTCLVQTLNNLILKNYRCPALEKRYPTLNKYYDELFSGNLGYEKVKEFSSEPTIYLFGMKVMSFPDEAAEETWTVFDHPIIRIYKRK